MQFNHIKKHRTDRQIISETSHHVDTWPAHPYALGEHPIAKAGPSFSPGTLLRWPSTRFWSVAVGISTFSYKSIGDVRQWCQERRSKGVQWGSGQGSVQDTRVLWQNLCRTLRLWQTMASSWSSLCHGTGLGFLASGKWNCNATADKEIPSSICVPTVWGRPSHGFYGHTNLATVHQHPRTSHKVWCTT